MVDVRKGRSLDGNSKQTESGRNEGVGDAWHFSYFFMEFLELMIQ